jgi:hypothetical protein
MAGNESYIRPGRLCTSVFEVWSNRAPCGEVKRGVKMKTKREEDEMQAVYQ